MSVFKSPKRKIFKRQKDVDAVLRCCGDLIEIVEGVQNKRWMDERGFRLKDTKEWCAFYVACSTLIED
jgi:hypothetical protein